MTVGSGRLGSWKVAREKQMTDGWTMGGESNPAAPEFTQSDSLILRLSRLSRRAFSVFGVGARPSNVNTLFLLQIHVSLLGRCNPRR